MLVPENRKIQISIYPEGGELITGAYNNIGILVNDECGQAVALDKLELVDGQGNVVRDAISINTFGIGKTGILVEEGKRYYLQLRQQNGGWARQLLPMAIADEIGLQIDNNGEDKVLCTLLANEGTFRAKETLNYSLAVYQDEFIQFEDIEIDQDEPVIALTRKNLPFGVLTAVLFNEALEPIAHRMFFNHRKDQNQLAQLEIDHCSTDFGDSLQLDLILPKGMQAIAQVSMTVLPNGTKAYRPNNSIVSSMVLNPYVNKVMEDAYFFDGLDRKKRYELDTRLLVEGWGRYDWNSRKYKDQQLNFPEENGIRISGRIADADLEREQQVTLITALSKNYSFQELQDDKTFTANMNLFTGDSLAISLVNIKGKLRKPEAEIQFMQPESLDEELSTWLNFNSLRRQWTMGQRFYSSTPLALGNRTIALDEVVVTEKKQLDNKFQISATSEGRLIRDIDIQRTPSMVSYLRKLGFMSTNNNNDGSVSFYVNRFPYPRAPVFINGMIAGKGEVIGMPLSRARLITYSKNGERAYISITINEKYVAPENRKKYIKFLIEKGYTMPQEYFQPNYPDDQNEEFKYYGALFWKPNIAVNAELPQTITVPLNNQPAIELYIEGMGNNGSLMSIRKIIPIDSKHLK